MIVVIQCAATKRSNAGHFRNEEGKNLLFVADPLRAPTSSDFAYARPDDCNEDGESWRKLLIDYNDTPHSNPFGLLPAFDLYENDIYRRLINHFGISNTYILSAGWGLISANFLTPAYDITFSAAADLYKRRKRIDNYRDACMLPKDTKEAIYFLGGKDYVPLFVELTRAVPAKKIIFYNSAEPPAASGCVLQKFETSTRTNWHYECASALIFATKEIGASS